jgi:hypothetical protein
MYNPIYFNKFFDKGDSGGAPAAGQGDKPTAGGESNNDSGGGDDVKSGDEATYNKADVEKLVADMQGKQRAEFETILENERKKAGMDDAQKAAFELEQKEKALEAKEAALALKELRADTAKLLSDKDMPQDFLEYIIGVDIEDTIKKLETFKPLFDKAVQDQVEKRMAGKTPERGNGQQTPSGETEREKIRNILQG